MQSLVSLWTPFECTDYTPSVFPEGVLWACPNCREDREWEEPDFKGFLNESSEDVIKAFNESKQDDSWAEGEPENITNDAESEQVNENVETTQCRRTTPNVSMEDNESVDDLNEQSLTLSKQRLCSLLDLTEEDLEFQPPMFFSLIFAADVWKQFFDFERNILVPRVWPSFVSKVLSEKTGCSFTASTAPVYRQRNFLVIYGHCSGDCEMRFSGYVQENPIQNNNVVMQVKSTGTFILLQPNPTNRQLRSQMRKEVQQELATTGSFLIFSVDLVHTDKLKLAHKNRQYGNLAVLRKAKSQAKLRGRGPDVYKDLTNLLEQFRSSKELNPISLLPGFIQDIGKESVL